MSIQRTQETPPTATDESPRKNLLRRLGSLITERSTWISHWQELADYILPRKFRYLSSDRNKGTKRNEKIVNNTATRAARILGAGKMAGQTSPARAWFRYVLSAEDGPIGNAEELAWLAQVQRIVQETFAKSNLYGKLHELWFLQGVFATATMHVEEDEIDDVRAHVFPLGSYCLYSTGKGRIDGIVREPSMTVEQVVCEFGLENCSPDLQRKWKDRLYDEWVDLVHEIRPNRNRDTGKIDNGNMAFESTWWEKSAPEDWTKPLRKSGFEEQPFVVARWDAIGEDIYGSGSPGMDCLGDTKALQILEKRKAEAVDKIVRPPMKAPVSAKTARLSMLPGDTSYVDETAQGARFEPAIVVNPQSVVAAKDAIKEHEQRIYGTNYADLFQMMLMDDRQQPATAREINERHEEKMLQLGPVVERDQDEVLDPLHNRVVRILFRRNKLPPMPDSLKGRRIKIQYTSVMAQAQKLIGTAATERAVSFVGSASAVNKEVLDLPNWDKLLRNYFDSVGLAPDEINSEDVVAQIRQARNQQQQMAQQAAIAQQAAESAKVASQADLNGDNVLSRLMNTVGGGGGPIN